LSCRDENAKYDCEFGTQDPVESSAESRRANRAEHGLPSQWIMIVPASCSMKFNRDGNARRGSRSDSKEETKADTVADSEDDRVRHHLGEQP
jgi:hypothetical protein